MGLDITAYSKLVEAPDAERDEDGYLVDYQNFKSFSDNPDFPGRIDGVKDDMAYKFEGDCSGLSTGYGRYSAWREELAKLAGYPSRLVERYGREVESYCQDCYEGAQGPFAEQINFSDCEGTIGTVAAAKLSKDYAEFAERAKAVSGDFWDKYQEWKVAFDLAADNGAVDFH
ncbi:hypothetical protein QN386_22395 [Pseudomonas sp. CCI3.2]|uniref:hypothetical protein n=1 Tax=unclassified Pseudomonas TaxID=196821 RepID=UPI002B234016|nr:MULTISPECIES: hypothetical protein [unclassified Pseudomonas]MEB0078048.1 hypothetical protein [Pseudomonas sp. MH10out]MEB0104055.1 hypothetical protein [Pseudomonas sp. CCI3.2]MEB0133401.1 hypothetical protein [Pseudomonas sp. CCI2.4]